MPTDPNVYWPARKVRVTFDGVSLPCQDGEYAAKAGEYDCTNILGASTSTGLLAEEHDQDTLACTLRFSVLVPKAAVTRFNVGALVAASYIDATGLAHSGSIRVGSRSEPVAVKGAFKFSVESKFTGAVSNE